MHLNAKILVRWLWYNVHEFRITQAAAWQTQPIPFAEIATEELCLRSYCGYFQSQWAQSTVGGDHFWDEWSPPARPNRTFHHADWAEFSGAHGLPTDTKMTAYDTTWRLSNNSTCISYLSRNTGFFRKGHKIYVDISTSHWEKWLRLNAVSHIAIFQSATGYDSPVASQAIFWTRHVMLW